MNRLLAACFCLVLCLAAGDSRAAEPWGKVVEQADGQTVYWNAWAGSEATNEYIQWVADEVENRFGITLKHVKVANLAESVSRVLAEKSAGKTDDGSVDLLWINGENFLAMKQNDLLYGPFAERLPNYELTNADDWPTLTEDFTVPTEGYEAPWGMAQIVFLHDTRRLPDPPRSMNELLAWAKKNPGRFTHPQVSNFMGSTFLKQALYELAEDPEVLQEPATDSNFQRVTEPLWAWYGKLRPHLWRDGEQFPENAPAQHQLLADAEVDVSISFHPPEASNLIQNGLLPPTVRTYVLDGGTIGNTHFLAIPFNSSSKEAAMVTANFLLSPEAQARKQDPRVWGDLTVLDLDGLSDEQRKVFHELPKGAATLSREELGDPLPEPHPSWMNRIVEEWGRRYSG
ncbi:ABC transporter substrate-binding protein [Desulfohalovibrio reitneri]|uniref:ABC transporter substrate-binding protein n=1 Tax=Desulfohalovibrio reitneri TaxID=1307759 RepID=UPI0004A77DCD|nr:ABC transporter substrate-binding protein [Desulfohalovibrio reitneri]